MKTINLRPELNIVVRLNPDTHAPKGIQVGTIESEGYKEPCPFCGQPGCHYSCDESQAGGWSDDAETNQANRTLDDQRVVMNAAIDGIESLILAAAVQGVDVSTKAFKAAIQTALDAVANEYGE